MELPEPIRINTFYPSQPHAKQQEILNALDSGTRFVLLRAGRKFRKTSLIISWLIEKALETGLTSAYIAPNRTQAKNIAWDDHVERVVTGMINSGLSPKKNEVGLTVKLPQGKLQLLGIENKEALRGISNWGAVACDEYDDWTEDIWTKIIRPNLITHKAPAIIAGTPKGYRNLYRAENSINDLTGQPLFKTFHFTSHANPELDPQELADLEAEYRAQGMGAYRQEILAEYEKPEGTVYEEWDLTSRYVPFKYDPNLPVHLSWDFGVNDPTSILFMQPNGSEIRIFDYYEASDGNIDNFVQYIKSLPYRSPSLQTGDIAGRARTLTTGKSPIDQLAKHKFFVRTSAIPDIPTQIRNTHKFIPRIFVSSSNPNCERVRDCFVNYQYPQRSSTLINQSNEVPIHDEYSHCMRALEYYCWNVIDPTQRIDTTPPQNSFAGFMRKKQQERTARREYIGY